MANENKKQVEQITDMEQDFAQWFTDVCVKAELVDYSSVKGLFILRPYGYAIWENIMGWLDRRFKEKNKKRASYYKYYTGHSWGRAWYYDLCLKTSSLGIEETVNILQSVIVS